VSLGAAVVVTCAGLNITHQGWFVVAMPGVIGGVTLVFHFVMKRRLDDWWMTAVSRMSSEERYWLDRVLQSLADLEVH